jgi:hypothetical protein
VIIDEALVMDENDDTSPPRRSMMRRTARILGFTLLWTVLTGMMAWAALAVALANISVNPPRYAMAGLLVLSTIVGMIILRRRRFIWRVPLFAFAIVLIWYLSLRASNERDWRVEQSRTPWCDIQGDQLTLHNVRNFDYHSVDEQLPKWEDRAYDLNHLRSVDLILCDWGSPDVAHVISSFGFDDGRYLAASIEVRREKGEPQDSLRSLFREYELIYIFGDERDLIRLRTNFRKEDLYLYRTTLSPAQARAVLLSYLGRANALATRPEWYNAITTNCATGVLPHARAAGAPGRWSIDIFLSGRAARQGYRNGLLDTSLPFEELENRSHINSAAVAAENAPDFSERIRAGLPGLEHPSDRSESEVR